MHGSEGTGAKSGVAKKVRGVDAGSILDDRGSGVPAKGESCKKFAGSRPLPAVTPRAVSGW